MAINTTDLLPELRLSEVRNQTIFGMKEEQEMTPTKFSLLVLRLSVGAIIIPMIQGYHHRTAIDVPRTFFGGVSARN
jgi:hypothetical protein